MGQLRDTVHDAMRPMPSALVLRRAATGDYDDADGGADPGALTVYRLQKDGGQPPVAPPRGPSAAGNGVPQGTAGAGGVARVVESITNPLFGLKDGFERSRLVTPVASDPTSSSPVLESSSGPAESPVRSRSGSVPVVSPSRSVDRRTIAAHASAPSHEASSSGSQAARGAPSGGYIAAPHARATPAEPVPGARVRGSVERRTASLPNAPPQAARATVDTGLRIGRIDVTVLAKSPPAVATTTASSLAESRFLSRHYLRRT